MANAQKNMFIALTAIMVVIMGIIALVTIKKTKPTPSAFNREVVQITTQSNSDEIDAIEKDLMDTDFENLDKELKTIETELESDY
ncbi:hypothetical protein KKB40_01155 [Patescibacteria group bacterium]|nr:hypothetical protein [Patescibacteria group bacterium]